MKTYVITLENHDDVISARDKISWSKANRVLLVWPRRGRVLERRVDLLILQRYAQSLGAQMGVVSGDGGIRANARDLGIPVFTSAAHAQDIPWRRPHRRGRIRVHRLRRYRPVQDAVSLRERLKDFRSPSGLPTLVRLFVFGIGLVAFLAIMLLFLPGAEIHLVPEQDIQQVVIPVWASPDIAAPNPSGGLPAQPLSVVVEGRDQAPSTGVARIPDRAAAGQVTVTNLTDQPIDLPAGSIVLSLNRPAERYITVRDVRVPGGTGKAVNVAVQAESAGREGNLPANRIGAIEGPLGLRLAVENTDPISGGRDRSGASPSSADYQALRDKLLTNLLATAEIEILSTLEPGLVLMPGSLTMRSVIEETHQPEANQPGDQLELRLRVEYQAMAVRQADLLTVTQAALDANPKDNYQPVADSLRYEFIQSPAGAANRTKENQWQLRAERELTPVMAESALAVAVRGRSMNEALEILQTGLPLAQPPEIRAFPSWWPRLPFLPFRIRLVQS